MRLLRSVPRALLLRCPHCGTGGLRSGWVAIAARCPGCRLRFDRGEPDYFLGAYTLNLFGALLIAVALAVVGIALPGLPHAVLYALGIAAIAGFALWFYPLSRLLWLAVDLAFRPAGPKDHEGQDQ